MKTEELNLNVSEKNPLMGISNFLAKAKGKYSKEGADFPGAEKVDILKKNIYT